MQVTTARVPRPGVSWPRLILVAVISWWTLQLVSGGSDWCFLDLVNLAFHEAGHVFLRPFGETIHFLGGTLFQLLVPAILIGYFLVRVPSRFGAAFCLWWLGESLHGVSVYMADARRLQLGLVGGGDHDWNHLFFTFGLLDEASVEAISAGTHLLASMLMLLGLAWAVLFVLPASRRDAVRRLISERAPRLRFLLD
jgi:hypothetical protein